MIVLLLACGGGDPALQRERRALEAWRRGDRLLDDDPAAALKAFREAEEVFPEDPVLAAWVAQAEARRGELSTAIRSIETVLEQWPRFAVGHYNRAAWLARAGRPDEAAVALGLALQLGAATEREAVQDPDFVPFLDHPAFAFLPDELLKVAVEVPEGAVFWGSEVGIGLRVLGTGENDVRVTTEQARGPLSLIGVQETTVQSTEGPSRDLRYTFRVDGAGTVALGPLQVQAGPWRRQVPAVRFQAEAPVGREGESRSLDLRTPSDVRAGWECTEPCTTAPDRPRIRRRGSGVDVLTAGGARLVPQADVRYGFAEEGRDVWQLWHYDVAPPSVRVRVGRDEPVELVPP